MIGTLRDLWTSDVAHDLRLSVGGFFTGAGAMASWFRVQGLWPKRG